MNVSILVSSFKYIVAKKKTVLFFFENQTNVFGLLSSLAKWTYQELVRINYTDVKLIRSINNNDLDVSRSLIHLRKCDLNNLLIDTFNLNDKFGNSKHEHEKTIYNKVKLLLEFGADVHYEQNKAIRTSCFRGYISVVKLLLRYSADIHVNNDEILFTLCLYNKTFTEYLTNTERDLENLVYAAEQDQLEVIKLILENRTDAQIYYDKYLLAACRNCNVDAMKLLLKYRIDQRALDLVLEVATARNLSIDIIKLLLECGASVYVDDDQSLRNARYNGNVEVVKLLLEYSPHTADSKSEIISRTAYNSFVPLLSYESYCKVISILDSYMTYTNM